MLLGDRSIIVTVIEGLDWWETSAISGGVWHAQLPLILQPRQKIK